jgi:DNA-binding protein H-NS
MADKFYSTLTSDLGNHYRVEMARRLTRSAPKHAGSMNFNELKIMSRKDSVETLSKLLGLRRQEIFRREQEEALALAGFRKKSKYQKFMEKSREEQATRQAELYLKQQQRKNMNFNNVKPKYYEPEARMSANSVGPAGYNVKYKRSITGGSHFGKSKTQRGGFLGMSYKEALIKAERDKKREEERILNSMSIRDNDDGGSRILNSEIRRHHHNDASMYGSMGSQSLRRGQQISSMGTRRYMISSGPRSNPTAPASISSFGLAAAPSRSDNKWNGPGPRYNVRQRYGHNGIGGKFSKGSRPDINAKNDGPDVMYVPSYTAVDKNRPNTTMCPRRSIGGIGTQGHIGPGPAYYPGYDNKGHMSSSKSFSFADIESRGRDKVPKRQLGPPDLLAPSIESNARSRSKSSNLLIRKRKGNKKIKKRKEYPKMNATLQETKELLADASIYEMRKGIWKKIRQRGDGRERNTD